MSERQRNLIDYIVVCVNEVARAKNMTNRNALVYLHEYKTLDFLEEAYDIEHTFSIEDTIEHMEKVCRNNGGIGV